MTRILYVSLGPVQDFIRQARRTRDLWAGSFLLSWLSGVAMAAVDPTGEAILYPRVGNDPLFRALTGQQRNGPHIGSLVNRFKAEVPDDFKAEKVRDAVQAKWAELADAVWRVFLEGLPPRTRCIWDRQIGAFWQVSWVIEDRDIPGSDALDRRKYWRVDALPPDDESEGGDHCIIMGDWQELSGYVRARGQKEEQDAFWDDVRRRVDRVIYGKDKDIGSVELRRSERLCATALVKRLFPLLPAKFLSETIGWIPVEDWKGNDQSLIPVRHLRKYPSTAYMAAVPWLIKTWRFAKDGAEVGKSAGQRYVESIDRRADEDRRQGIHDHDILAKAEATPRIKALKHTGAFGDLDGTFFFLDGIARRRTELRPSGGDEQADKARKAVDEAAIKVLSGALKALQTATAPVGGRRQRKMREASPFYALLLMDGDRMGQALRTLDAGEVSAALSAFTQSAGEIVYHQNGLTIYAGGDDVLALLPIHTALATAQELSDAFREAFPSEAPMTASAAVVFAHYTTPLGFVLDTAHTRLTRAAKDANGRDSLAVTVLKPGGSAADWVSAWDLGNGERAVAAIENLADAFAREDERSSAFLHHIGERFGDVLSILNDPTEGDEDARFLDENLVDLLLAERLKGKEGAVKTDPKLRREMEELAAVCRPRRNGDKKGTVRPFVVDGALLVKFLADNGGWYREEEQS